MARLQNLPYLGTAEEDVLLVEWLVSEGERVRRGQPVATVETLKAAFEVEAEADGVLLRQLCGAGERVEIRSPLAVLGGEGEACDDGVVAALLTEREAGGAAEESATETPAPATAPQPFTAGAAGPGGPVAPAARRRAAELGIDPAAVTGTGPEGLVRVVDVERAHEAGVGVSPPGLSARSPAANEGRIDPALLAFIRRDVAGFAALPSSQKLDLYRRHGARIGDACHLAPRSVLLVDRLLLGDRAYFGPDTTIEGGLLAAGDLLHFGARCRVRCTSIRCGDNAFFTDDIEIGGGGALEPEAELVVGSHGFVGEHVHLNPCRRLAIGDEVVISREAVIMTHSFGPSWLRGYPSRFAPSSVGDGSQIGIGAVLFPGVDVGAGAVVLSGSSVVTSVPAGRLVGGVPAVDLKGAADRLDAAGLAERARSLVDEFARQLELRGFAIDRSEAGGRRTLRVRRDGGDHELLFAGRFEAAPETADGLAERVIVAIGIADELLDSPPPDATVIALDPPRVAGPLGPLASAFREFLRKRGVRLHPRSWAYTGGWL